MLTETSSDTVLCWHVTRRDYRHLSLFPKCFVPVLEKLLRVIIVRHKGSLSTRSQGGLSHLRLSLFKTHYYNTILKTMGTHDGDVRYPLVRIHTNLHPETKLTTTVRYSTLSVSRVTLGTTQSFSSPGLRLSTSLGHTNDWKGVSVHFQLSVWYREVEGRPFPSTSLSQLSFSFPVIGET